MSNKYIDTHCHLLKEYFVNDGEIQKEVKEAFISGVGRIILPGTQIDNSWEAIETSQNFSNVYPAFGVHPSDSKKQYELIDDALKKLDPNQIIALGEIGLDLYWEDNPKISIQEDVLRKFIEYGIKNNLPLILHMRNAEEDMIRILSDSKYNGQIKFIIHSCTTNPKWIPKFLELGGYISFSGIVTFRNAKEVQESAKLVPLNKILTETDAPYLSPTPHRGKTNKPSYLPHTTKFLAKLRGEDLTEFIDAVWNNANKIFDFSKLDNKKNERVNNE